MSLKRFQVKKPVVPTILLIREHYQEVEEAETSEHRGEPEPSYLFYAWDDYDPRDYDFRDFVLV